MLPPDYEDEHLRGYRGFRDCQFDWVKDNVAGYQLASDAVVGWLRLRHGERTEVLHLECALHLQEATHEVLNDKSFTRCNDASSAGLDEDCAELELATLCGQNV